MAKKRNKARAEPKNKRSTSSLWLCSDDAYSTLVSNGYTNLAHNPEIIAGVDTIAKLVGSMTIHLMQNAENGDIRVKNELSRKVDIEPNKLMTRSMLVQWIVRTMYLEGNGNAFIYPKFEQGYLEELRPLPAGIVSMVPKGIWDFEVSVNGEQFSPDQLLHFPLNPGTTYPWKGSGIRVPLKDVADNLKQAAVTQKGFNSSKWKPSVIVKVDSGSEELADPEGRRMILKDYIETSEAGEPWVIPAEQFDIEVVKPLSLSDLALAEMVQIDKRTVASILRIPSFVLGVGSFNYKEWNNFISSTIKPIAQIIEQELTRKLLYSPNYYFRMNQRSLYNYDLKDMAAIAKDQYVIGTMSGNEVRDWIGLSPREGLDDLIILENYIPRGMIGQQSKLVPLEGGE